MGPSARCACVVGQLLLGWLLLTPATPTVHVHVPTTRQTTEPAVVGWDGQWLQTLRQEVASTHGIRPSLRPALTALRSSAHSLLSLEAPSVVTAGSVPLPGTGVSPHDMWYLATYAWPCGAACNLSYFKDCSHWWQPPHYKSHGSCDNATGMPWEQHDGYVQPKDISDMTASDTMSDAVTTLALAHYLFSNETFGEKAAALLDVWFVAAETAMTPNVQHAAIVPGVTNGSSTGIIVTSHRWNSRLTDSIALLASTGALPPKVAAGVARWNDHYLEWLLTSKNGLAEANMSQNHATWHTVESAALAMSNGDVETAVERLARLTSAGTPAALAQQIQPSGLMPREAARTNGAAYSCMNLAGLFNAATIATSIMRATTAAEHGNAIGSLAAPQPPDLFSYRDRTGAGSIRAALDYLLEFATNSSNPWPWPGVDSPPWTELAPQMLQAAVQFREPKYEEMIDLLPWPGGTHWPQTHSWETNIARLVYPSSK